MSFIPALLLLLLLLMVVLVAISRNPNVSPLLTTSLFFFVILWYVIPIVAMCFFPSVASNPSDASIEDTNFAALAATEALVLLVTCLFLLRRRPYFSLVLHSPAAEQHLSPGVVVGLLLTGLGLVAVVGVVTTGLLGTGYLDRNSFSTTAQDTPLYNAFGSLEILTSLATSVAYASLLTVWPKSLSRRLILLVVCVWILYITVSGALLGSRIALLTPLVVFILYNRVHGGGSGRRVVQTLLIGVLTLTLGGTLGLIIGQSRGATELRGRDVLDQLLHRTESEDSLGPIAGLVRELVTKYNMHSSGLLLVEREGIAVAGWQPFAGSLVALVPRFMMPSKPVPGSANGEYSGHPTRIAAVLLGMDPLAGNVQVSPAAISLWELGYPALAGLVLCNVIGFYFINSLLLCRSIVHKALGISMIGIPIFITLFSSVDNWIQSAQRTGMILIAYSIGHRIFSLKAKR